VIIDPIDLKLIRLLELHGSIPTNEIICKFQITEQEMLLRIKNFEDSEFIESYGIKLFLPGIIGGKWYWGCIASETTPRFKPEHSVPYLEEIVENLTFPSGVCPDLSLLFYTQSLEDTYRIINKAPGIKYAEIYKINEYDINVQKILLKDDWLTISRFCDHLSTLDYTKIHAIHNKPDSDSDVKLARLLWSKKNKKGVLSIFPNFNWSIIKNYVHLHCAVTTKMRAKDLRKIVNKLGFSGNITSRFKKRYFQLEFDIWGFSDMQTLFSILQQEKKLAVEGYSFGYKNRIYNNWVKEYINDKI